MQRTRDPAGTPAQGLSLCGCHLCAPDRLPAAWDGLSCYLVPPVGFQILPFQEKLPLVGSGRGCGCVSGQLPRPRWPCGSLCSFSREVVVAHAQQCGTSGDE